MDTKVQARSSLPAHLAVACVTALVAHHKLFETALREVANHQANSEASARYDWAVVGTQLDKALDHAMHSISALHAAAGGEQAGGAA